MTKYVVPEDKSFELRKEWQVRASNDSLTSIQEGYNSQKFQRLSKQGSLLSLASLARGNGVAEVLASLARAKKGWRSTFCEATHPSSQWRAAWDCTGMLMIFYDIVSMPFFLAFDPSESGPTTAMFFVTLTFWSTDLLYNFHTGYYRNGEPQLRFRDIATHYLRNWFLCDASMVAMDWITVAFGPSSDTGDLRYVSSIRTLRLLRSMRLIRLLKLRHIMEEIEDRIHSESLHIIMDVLKGLFTIILICHIIACSWFAVGLAQDDSGWVNQFGVIDRSTAYQYATSLHWSLTQFAPASMEVGPRTTNERMFNIVMILFGLIIFSSFISSVTAATGRLRQLSSQKDRQLFILRRFLKERKVPTGLQLRIKKYVHWAISHHKNTVQESDVALLKMLSVPLKMDLDTCATKPLLLGHPFFRRFSWVDSNAFRQIIHSALVRIALSEGDVLFTAGLSCDRMFFVDSGVLGYTRNSVTQSSQSKDSLSTVSENSIQLVGRQWCCEAALWTSWVHVGTLRAATMCDIVYLDALKFSQATLGYETVCSLAATYAQRFVQELNRKKPDELSDLPSEMRVDPFAEAEFEVEVPFGAQMAMLTESVQSSSITN